MRRLALIGLAGTSVEWFDFYVYGVASALVFPALFFPASLPPLVGLMASFSTFAVGFFARPFGAALFGHLGDRTGRRAALVAALVLMGGATTLIGCLPPYATLGVLAPVLLVLLRFLQGLAIGGQWGGAMLIIVERAPAGRRGFYGSFAQAGAPAGAVAANLAFLIAVALSTPETFLGWGWRVPFLLGLACLGLAFYIRSSVDETPVFRELEATPRRGSPVLEALASSPRQIILAAGAYLAVQVAFYISSTFVVGYGSSPGGLALPRATMLTAVLIASGVTAPCLIWFGALSDRHGRRRIYMWGSALLAVWAFAYFPLIDTRSPVLITVAMCVAQFLTTMMYGPQAALLGELFRTRVRYSGASLGYQLGAVLGGALAPFIATAILAAFHGTFGISVYIAAACAITLVSVALLGETSSVDLGDRGPG